MGSEGKSINGKHFVLVHGACHGAWCWFKVTTLLEQAGHRVTALDLGACGRRSEKRSDIKCFEDYAKPLMEVMKALPTSEKVILVGHSLGGISLAWVMETFPENVSVAVFATAFMPDCSHPPSYPLEQYFAKLPGIDPELDVNCEVEEGVNSQLFSPIGLKTRFYQNCSPEYLTLGKSLMRPQSLFITNLSTWPKFTEGRYGSVSRVYIVCNEDQAIPEEYQRWMIENYPTKEVKEIATADHMVMFSTPQEMSNCLLEVANGIDS